MLLRLSGLASLLAKLTASFYLARVRSDSRAYWESNSIIVPQAIAIVITVLLEPSICSLLAFRYVKGPHRPYTRRYTKPNRLIGFLTENLSCNFYWSWIDGQSSHQPVGSPGGRRPVDLQCDR